MKETIKALREKHNYSQNTVAQYLGISRQMYIKYENEDIDPPVKTIVALAELYKVCNDVIIQNQLCPHKEIAYITKKNSYMEVASSTPVYNAPSVDNTSTVLNLLQDLPFEGLLKVLGKVSGLLQLEFNQQQVAEQAIQQEAIPQKKRFSGELSNSKTPKERAEAEKWFEETSKLIESNPMIDSNKDIKSDYINHLRGKYESSN